jgi:hypothetical protein
MKYQFFWKQAYQGTGSQRYSSEEVTDSIQTGLQPFPACCVTGASRSWERRFLRNRPAKSKKASDSILGLLPVGVFRFTF